MTIEASTTLADLVIEDGRRARVLERFEVVSFHGASITNVALLIFGSAVVLMVGLGFFPQPLLNVINPAIDATLAHIGVGDPAPQTPANLSATSDEGSHE